MLSFETDTLCRIEAHSDLSRFFRAGYRCEAKQLSLKTQISTLNTVNAARSPQPRRAFGAAQQHDIGVALAAEILQHELAEEPEDPGEQLVEGANLFFLTLRRIAVIDRESKSKEAGDGQDS